MYNYETALFDRYNGERDCGDFEADFYADLDANLYYSLESEEENMNTECYEIVVRSSATGGIMSVIGPYTEEEAELFAFEMEAEDEDVWCEVRRERF